MHTAKRPHICRLWTIDRELRAEAYPNVRTLCEQLGVNEKTVRLDLHYLRDHYHAPVDYDHQRRGWYYTSKTWRLPAVLITEGELLAMFLAGQLLKQHAGTPYEPDLQRAIRKLAELLPDEVSFQWDTVERAHSVHNSVSTRPAVDTFRQLADAVLNQRQLRLTYWSASRDEVNERTVDPWHLAIVDGETFLIGYCHLRQAERMFAPARIRQIAVTGHSFTVPDTFNIHDYFAGMFRVIRETGQPVQTVRLRFQPSAAKYLRERQYWHASQTMHEEPDGCLVLEFTLQSLIEVRRFALSWGSECEVLAPQELRADIAREAAAIAARPVHDVIVPRIIPRPPKRKRQTG